MVSGKKGLCFGELGFSYFWGGKRRWYLLSGNGIDLSTRIYFDSHGLGTIARRELKVGIECDLSIQSALCVEHAFSPTASGDTVSWDHLCRVLGVLVWSGMAIRLVKVLGRCVMAGAVGRGPGSVMALTVAAVPVRGTAGSSSSAVSAYTAPGRVASPWGLSATSLFASPLSTQGCEVVVTTEGIALLTFNWVLGMEMGVSTLVAAIVRGNSEGISMN